jgi:hypothetical protein
MRAVGLVLGFVVLGGTLALRGQQSHQHEAGRLGMVKFANSCAARIQPDLARGMALLHSFEFGPAMDAFKLVADADPSCAIAHWGIAMSQWSNPFSNALRPVPQLEAGRSALARAAAIGAKTPRERDFVSAAAALYDQFETVDQGARQRAYRDAMAAVAAKHGDDPEASAFYALALAAAADPADKTYVDQLKAGASAGTS